MKLNAKGIVIKVAPYGEANRSVTLLTSEYGIIHAFVYGASSVKNKNNTATSLLCYSDFTLTKKDDTYRIDEASAIELFFDLRNDIVSSSLAQYFCEVFALFSPEESYADEYLRLILNSLSFLCRKNKNVRLIKSVTELYLMKLCGYMPELTACAICGHEESAFSFDCNEGVLVCSDCAGGEGYPVSKTVLDAMRFIVYSPFEKIYNFSLPDEEYVSLNAVTERFLINRAEHNFKTLDFFKTVI